MTLLSAWREAADLARDYDEPYLVVETADPRCYRVVAERDRGATDRPVLRVNCDRRGELLEQ